MPNLFSKILKHKKIVALSLLLFIAVGVIFPQIASAAVLSGITWGAGIGCVAGLAGSIGLGWLTGGLGWATVPAALGACAAVGKVGAVVGGVGAVASGSAANGLDVAIIRGITDLLYNLADQLANFASGWLSFYLTSGNITTPVLNQPGYAQGWALVRDLTNMLIVLGFVVIGIATALRVQEYEAKKLLPRLIIVALLVNFSWLLCGMIIDASNIITVYFLQGNSSIGLNMVQTLEVQSNQTNWSQLATLGAGTYLQAAVPFTLGFFIIAITYFYLAIIMIVRGAIFGIFFVLSPLAFFCWVFPETKKVWNMWLENFIKWALIGAQVIFFLWVASKMAIPNTGTAAGSAVLKTGPGAILGICIMLYVATTVARRSSAIGASAILGFAAGAGMNAVRKARGAGVTTLKSGFSGLASNPIGQKGMEMMERMRILKPGTSTKPGRTAIDGYKKEFSRLNDQQISNALDRRHILTPWGANQKAALAEMAIERGNFDPNNNRHVEGLKYAQSNGFTLSSDHIDKDPRLAPHDAGRMEKLKKTMNPATGANYTDAEAADEATKQVVTGLSPKEAREKLRAGPLGDINVVKHMSLEQTEGMEFASPKKRVALREFAFDGPKKDEFDKHILNTTDPDRQGELLEMQKKFKTF